MSFHLIAQWTYLRFVSLGNAFDNIPVWNVIGNVSRPGTNTRRVLTWLANVASVMIRVRMSALRWDSRFSDAGADGKVLRYVDYNDDQNRTSASLRAHIMFPLPTYRGGGRCAGRAARSRCARAHAAPAATT